MARRVPWKALVDDVKASSDVGQFDHPYWIKEGPCEFDVRRSPIAIRCGRNHVGRTFALNNRNLRGEEILHHNRPMETRLKTASVALLYGLSLCGLWGQESRFHQDFSTRGQRSNANYSRQDERTLTADDGLSVIAAALDSKVRRHSGRDCSHLVHAIYERAGFPYAYASSSDLYAGREGLQLVARPQPGDLIVWRGHVGIIIRPSRHVFFSYLREGPGVDDYQAPYWTSRGRPRFYRYVKNDSCAGCARAR
jgi:NlpC/P60 family